MPRRVTLKASAVPMPETTYKAGGGYQHATFQRDAKGASFTLLFYNREPLILRRKEDAVRLRRDLAEAIRQWPEPTP